MLKQVLGFVSLFIFMKMTLRLSSALFLKLDQNNDLAPCLEDLHLIVGTNVCGFPLIN